MYVMKENAQNAWSHLFYRSTFKVSNNFMCSSSRVSHIQSRSSQPEQLGPKNQDGLMIVGDQTT
jgi:hypothetical protein